MLIDLFSILEGEYHYYQGFHDIAVYLMMIFNIESERRSFLEFLQRVIEFYFKDYTSEFNKNRFDFQQAINIFVHLVELKDKASLDKLKLQVEEYSPYFVLSWIVSWLTQSIKNSESVYRILDFLICSHPIAIYHLSAEVRII